MDSSGRGQASNRHTRVDITLCRTCPDTRDAPVEQRGQHPHNKNTMHHVLTSKCHKLGCVQNGCEEGRIQISALQNKIRKKNSKHHALRPSADDRRRASPGLLIGSLVSTPLFIVYLLSVVRFHRVLFEVVALLHDFSGHFLCLRM